MKLTALNQIRGIEKVLHGKGKGTRIAHAGDHFEADEKEAERLINKGAAVEYTVNDPVGDAEEQESEQKQAGGQKKTSGKQTGGQKKTSGKQADDGSDTAGDDDMGLGG